MKIGVAHVKLKNILGIDHLEFSPGKFTVITGGNGQGKSSVLEGIKSVLKDGHDATLLRAGAERGSAVLVLDDGSQLAKAVSAEGSTRRFVDPNGDRAGRPAEAIRALVDVLSVNPIEFLTADKKRQIGTLLEAMPLQADVERLAKITGGQIAPELARTHAMLAIDTVHGDVFDERTGVNRAVKEKKGTISQLEAAIPAALADVDAVDENALEQALTACDTARDAELARIAVKLDGMETDWSNQLDAHQKAIDEINKQVAALKDERANVRARAEKQRQLARDNCAAERRPVEERQAVIRSDREAAARARTTRETIDRMKTEVVTLEAEATKATQALADLEAYKLELLETLPIPGLTVKEGSIYYKGTIFERVNTAARYEVAVEVAKLRAGDLGLVCVDGLENLEADNFEAFRKAALKSDVQFVVTRVGAGPLTVETES